MAAKPSLDDIITKVELYSREYLKKELTVELIKFCSWLEDEGVLRIRSDEVTQKYINDYLKNGYEE